MRIKRLHIDGFGRFSDRDFGPLDHPVTVFFGPNEAGKTTLLAFLRTMLFGFPGRKRDEHYPALGGGVHGGRLWLEDSSGVGYDLIRSESKGKLAVTVSTTDERRSADDELLSAALGHATKETFESVFAFSLSDLQEFSTLATGAAAAQIYSAGMGAAKLPQAQGSIQKRREEIFKPGGSKQVISETLARFQHVEGQLRESSRNAEMYGSLLTKKEAVQGELAEATARTSLLNKAYLQAQSLRGAWDDWIELELAREGLEELPVIDGFPVGGQAQVDRLVERRDGAIDSLRDARSQLAEALAEAKVPDGALAILEHEEAIVALQQGREAFVASVSDAPKRLSELERETETLGAQLREIGPGWDAAKVEQFDASVEVQARIDDFRRRLEHVGLEARTAQERAGRAGEDHQHAQNQLADLQKQLQTMPAPAYSREQVDERKRQIVRARGALGLSRQAEVEVQAYRREMAARRQMEQAVVRTNPFYPFAAILVILGILAFAGAFALSGAGGIAVAAAGVALVGIAGVGVYAFRPRARIDAEIGDGLLQSTEQRFSEAQQTLQKTAASLGVPTIEEESLERLEVVLHRVEESSRAYAAKLGQMHEAAEEERRLGALATGAQVKAESAEDTLVSAVAAWQAWLDERGLPVALAPQSIDALFARIEGARTQLRAVTNARHRLEAIQLDITRYQERVQAMADVNGLRLTPDSLESFGRTADALINALIRARDTRATQQANEKEAERLGKSVTRSEEDVQRIEAALATLLEAGGTSSEDEFRKRSEDEDRRRLLLDQARDAEGRLRKLAVRGAGLLEIEALLRSTDALTLEARAAELGEEMGKLSETQNSLAREAGEIDAELKRLVSDEETSVLRAEREVLREQLAAAAKEWATLTVAQSMLREAQERYQRERQPGVIKSADAIFGSITDGRYSNLMSPLGDDKDRKLTVIDRDGSDKTVEQLSRGTQEALYLALRFGLIRQFGEQACNLPVIVDEVLVNLDPERQARTAQQFAELAKTNQVLVFTCHPAMVELFRQVEPSTQVIEIGA